MALIMKYEKSHKISKTNKNNNNEIAHSNDCRKKEEERRRPRMFVNGRLPFLKDISN